NFMPVFESMLSASKWGGFNAVKLGLSVQQSSRTVRAWAWVECERRIGVVGMLTALTHKKWVEFLIKDSPHSNAGCGGSIGTYDLRVMSPTSYQAAPPRVRKVILTLL